MKNIIVGTAGHIDHGKTALVKALTGIDADRLEEEKRRGITIDIGFAHLQLTPDLRLGFVDVPGHERFIKNMLAGVSGIDLVLFVIAADESIKPQTREHFDICRLLGIPQGVVALTKADLVEPDILELVRLEVEEFVAGFFLEGAPVVAVSSVTGAGLEQLRSELARAASAAPSKRSVGHFRLPLDRAFTVRGFGTVVTGTLISGSVSREQEVELYPTGRLLRVRGVQVYGQPAERASGGERTALNLADIEPAEVARGMVLAAPGVFRTTTQIDCALQLLPSSKPLKHRAPVHFHAGTAEIEAQVRLLDGAAALQPGQRGWRSPHRTARAGAAAAGRPLYHPHVLSCGDDRRRRGGRHRRQALSQRRPPGHCRAAADSHGSTRVRPHRFAGAGNEVRYGHGRTGGAYGPRGARDRCCGGERAGGRVQAAACAWFSGSLSWFQSAREKLLRALQEFHRKNPLQPGIAKQDLRGRELPDSPPFLIDAILAQEKQIVVEGENVRLASHKLVLKQDEEQARAAIERAFEQAGLAVPALPDVLAKSGVETARARSLLQILLREKRLIRVSDDLVFHCTAMGKLRTTLAGHKAARFNVGAFKDWTGISRKYAIPLLEYLDRARVTRREGDERVVL